MAQGGSGLGDLALATFQHPGSWLSRLSQAPGAVPPPPWTVAIFSLLAALPQRPWFSLLGSGGSPKVTPLGPQPPGPRKATALPGSAVPQWFSAPCSCPAISGHQHWKPVPPCPSPKSCGFRETLPWLFWGLFSPPLLSPAPVVTSPGDVLCLGHGGLRVQTFA